MNITELVNRNLAQTLELLIDMDEELIIYTDPWTYTKRPFIYLKYNY